MFRKLLCACVLLSLTGGFVASIQAAPIIIDVVRSGGASDTRDPIGTYTGTTDPIAMPAGGLTNGNYVFSDRTYTWSNTPTELNGSEYVPTFNNDKNSAASVTYTLTLSGPARLGIAIDDRWTDQQARVNTITAAVVPPGTLVDTGLNVYVGGDSDRPLSVFEGPVPGGTHVLSGAGTDGNNFMVIIVRGPLTLAHDPSPADGSSISSTTVALGWTAGSYATQHHIYLSSVESDVVNRTGAADKGLTTSLIYPALGLTPGTTYYWAIDEVNDVHPDSPWVGDVWSFTVTSLKAYDPTPEDGAENQLSDVTLQWSPGLGAFVSRVFWGTDYDTVLNKPADQYDAQVSGSSYALTGLAKDADFYWRIDTVDTGGITTKGDVWTFSTVPYIPPSEDPNLLVLYEFEEGGGTTALDTSGNGRHGALQAGTGGLPTRVAGLFGDAMEFTGNGNRVVYDADGGAFLNGLSQLSVAVWVKSDVINTDKGFINFADPAGNDQRGIRYDSAGGDGGADDCFKYGVTTNVGSQQVESPGNLQVTDWQHVAMVWTSGQAIQFYLDGALLAPSHPADETPDGTTIGNTKLVVGQGGRVGMGSSWDGLVDDVRVFDKALTQQEVQDIMRGDPELAWNPSPSNRAQVDVEAGQSLSWSPGDTAISHDVYFGTDKDAVTDATTSTTGIYAGRVGPNNYSPSNLVFGVTYYWRIDEVDSGGGIHKGYTWTFTTVDYLVLEDFEIYGDSTNVGQPGSRMWYTWRDGYGWTTPTPVGGNGTGSSVGNWPAPVAETTVVHGGDQAMPFWYNNSGTGSDALGVPITARYSETERTLSSAQNFTRNGVRALSLWFQGFEAPGSTSVVGNAITVEGAGADIWNASDEFHFAHKQITVAQGVFTAKVHVDSIENTNGWAKAGIMIRDSLDADSANAFIACSPGNGTTAQIRLTAGDTSASISDANLVFPAWIAMTRDSQGDVRGYYSTTGTGTVGDASWTQVGTVQSLIMTSDNYIGLAVTSHSAGNLCTAVFSNFTMNSTSVSGLQGQDIGITSNDTEPLYVALTDSLSHKGIVYHPDAGAVNMESWTEWNIDLKDFQDQGVNLSSVTKVAIGVGVPGGSGSGSGKMYFDDISLYPPRYIEGLGTPIASDLDSNGQVDLADAEVMFADWLASDSSITTSAPTSPSAWYKLDGNLADSAGGSAGTAYGSPVYGAGMDNQALTFDGMNDYVIVPDGAGNDFGDVSFTVALWLKSEFVPGSAKQFIICNGTNSSEFTTGGNGPDGRATGKRYVLKFENSALQALIDSDTDGGGKETLDAAATDYAIGDWVHVTFVRDADANEMHIYRNGVLDVSNLDVSTTDILSVGEPLYIGAKLQENAGATTMAEAPIDHYFEGMLDDIRIYNVALNEAQASYLAALGAAENYVPLESPANLSPKVGDVGVYNPANPDVVNFKDLAIMLGEWMQKQLWPEW